MKKLIKFVFNITLVVGFFYLFFATFWFDNIWDPSKLFNDLNQGVPPSGVLNSISGFDKFFSGAITENSPGIVVILVKWVLPIVFGLVFSCICTTIINLIFKIIYKPFKKKKNVQSVKHMRY